jgi:hypothetical protein
MKQMHMRRALTILSIFTASLVHAQDLTGIWQGHFRSTNLEARSSLFDDRYKFEVQIAQHEKKFDAVTYSYLSSIFYGKAEANGTVNAKTGKVLLQEGKLVELRMSTPGGGPCIMTCFLQYSKSGDEEFLEGSYGSMNIQDSSNCGRGTIFLRKVTSSDFYKEPFLAKREKEIESEGTKITPVLPKPTTPKPVTPGPATPKLIAKNTPPLKKRIPDHETVTRHAATPDNSTAKSTTHKKPVVKEPVPMTLSRVSTEKPDQSRTPIHTDAGIESRVDPMVIPNVLVSRSNELIRTITVNTNEVTLNIYDDGVIDHDTVSVYVDKMQVVSHAMLRYEPIVVTLHLDESRPYHEVVMVAENEGDIPPNTSLMIVKAGDKQYEVRISSTEQKNAVVVFKFEKLK